MIRLFVGTDPNGDDAESCLALEYSVRSRCSQPVDIVWMRHSRDRLSFWSGWDGSLWATPFSGFRWGIPAYCGFQGRAIYTDSDVIFIADLAELWNTEITPGHCVVAKGGWRFCVSLWDCAAAEEVLLPLAVLKTAEGHRRQNDAFRGVPWRVQTFAPGADWNYNDLDDFGPLSGARAVHFTDMSTQPHLGYAIQRLAFEHGQAHWYDGPLRTHKRSDLVALWQREYEAALDAGYRVENYVPRVRYGDYRKASLVNYRKGA